MGIGTLYYERAVLNDGPLGFWRLIKDATDISGNGNHLLNSNGTPVFGQNIGPTVRSQDGATGVLLAGAGVGDNFFSSGGSWFKTPQISLEIWGKPSAISANDQAAIGCFSFSGHYRGYDIEVTQIGNVWDCAVGTSSSHDLDSAVNNPVVGVWQHVVITYDGITGKLYVNGLLEASFIDSSGLDYGTVTNFTIGNWSTPTATRNWLGTLYGGAFYNYALSQTQVTTHYQAGINPFAVVYNGPTTNPTIIQPVMNPVPTLQPLGNQVVYTIAPGTQFILAQVDDDYGAPGQNEQIAPGVYTDNSAPPAAAPSAPGAPLTHFLIDRSNDPFINFDDLIGDGNRDDDDDDEDEDDDEFISWDPTKIG